MNIRLFIAVMLVAVSGCKMAGETKSGWYAVQLKDDLGEVTGKTIQQVKGEALSRGLHQAVLQYHSNYISGSETESRALFVLITNRRNSEDYIIVTTPDKNSYRFHVYAGGLIFDKESTDATEEEYHAITRLIELMNEYDELKISQGSFYFTINTAGFSAN